MAERWAALAFLAASVAYTAGAWTFPLGTAQRPGPGFFPLAVGGFACAVALVFAANAFRRPAAAAARADAAAEPGARGRVVATTLALVGFCLLVPWAGYPAVAFLFVTTLIKRLGGTGWAVAVITGLVSAAASAYVFGTVLGVPLPRGLLLD
jgi:putative tricarboxylic transport membrane protein